MGKAETIRSAKLGKAELRLVRKDGHFHGLVDGIIRTGGDDADQVWQELQGEVAKANPQYFGFTGAKARFLKAFPGGFASSEYETSERSYKLAARAKLEATLPLAAALSEAGFGAAALTVFQATNLLSVFEKTRLRDLLRGPAGDSAVRAIAHFAAEPGKATLRDLERILAPHECAKWTVVTYLPFLWRPDVHMFLKPDTTKDFAARVGHRFATDYAAGLDIAVYDSLLDLVQRTEQEIADLHPRDHIDVQSFVWIVGNYPAGPD